MGWFPSHLVHTTPNISLPLPLVLLCSDEDTDAFASPPPEDLAEDKELVHLIPSHTSH